MGDEGLDLESRIKVALEEKDIPLIYFNGFVNTLGTGDILIILERNKKPVAVLNASYTIAKTLVEKLGQIVNDLEKITENKIMTQDYINQKFGRSGQKNVKE